MLRIGRGRPFSVEFVDSDEVIRAGDGYFVGALGVASPSGIELVAGVADGPAVSGFGFSRDGLLADERHFSGGATMRNGNQLTADPTYDTFVLFGATLVSLEADAIADGTTLWTSNGTASDTFIFSSSAPVPEPSSALLSGLAIMSLLRRRR